MPFDLLYDDVAGAIRLPRGVSALIRAIERATGGRLSFDGLRAPLGDASLVECAEIARKLKRAEILESFGPYLSLPDEPQVFSWQARYRPHGESAGGLSLKSDRDALLATLAEALERYLWAHETDYYRKPVFASTHDMRQRGAIIAPERFAGFSDNQRAQDPRLSLRDSDEFLWINGTSLLSGKEVFLPAQTAAGSFRRSSLSKKPEQVIRPPITTGLATWPTRLGARLRGALEVIERDAFMIMWLNQLALPRIDLHALAAESLELRKLLEACERYSLKIHAIRLITDAPTYAACVAVEDLSDIGPRFSFGLKAGAQLDRAIISAGLEALRSRQNVRLNKSPLPDSLADVESQKPFDRLGYWGDASRSRELEFIISGALETSASDVWENESDEKHLSRMLAWCRTKNYEIAAVDLGRSKKNPLPWNVEMVVMPDLQPLSQDERFPCLGGARLKEILEAFGFEARQEPFSELPHPFS